MSGNLYPNVIVFGETGAGKSSVINMLDGGGKAAVSDKAKGVTFSSQRYEKNILGRTFNVFDTVGLNEGSAGTVAAQDAIKNLYKLIGQLDTGLSLLVYVMRAPRIKATAKVNYQLFYETFCDRKVHIVIVVTGLEERDDMDEWWTENQHVFGEYGMRFYDHACVTATRGKRSAYEAEYQASKGQVEQLISKSMMPQPWKEASLSWFSKIFSQILAFLNLEPVGANKLYVALCTYAGLSKSEAKAKADEIEKSR